MATVTVYTAARMLEIYNASIVDAAIVGGHAIFTTQGGTDIDAGALISAGDEPFVGQYTTVGAPDATLSDGMIYWDIDESSFYKSNGAIWEEAPMGGGGGDGDVSSTDDDVTGWEWVVFAAELTSDLDTKVPTEARVNNMIASSGVAAQVASANVETLDIYQVGGITYFEVIGGSGGGVGDPSFSDADFEVYDNLDVTKKIAFSLSALSQARSFAWPDQDGTVVTDTSTADLANKTLATSDGAGNFYGKFADRLHGGIEWSHTVLAPLNNSVNVAGGPIAVPSFVGWHNQTLTPTPTQTSASAEILRIASRIMRSNGTFGTTDNARVSFISAEAPTTAAQGSDVRIGVTRIGSLTLENILNVQGGVDAATMGTVSVRGQMIVGKGDASTKPAAGYAIESAHATNAIGYGVGAGNAVTQLTSKATATPAITTPNGTVTTHNASLAAATVVSFVLTNANIGANDHVLVFHVSGGTVGAYTVTAAAAAGSATIYVRNNTAGALGEALVLRYVVLKGSVA